MRFRTLLFAIVLLALGQTAQAGLNRHDLAEAGFHLTPGTLLPTDATMHTPTGDTTLGSLLADRPALLVFTDYRCESLCGVVLDRLADVLPAVPLNLGRDYNVIAVALDGMQTQTDAVAFRDTHTRGSTLHDRGHFLTNDAPALTRLESSVGLVAPFDAEHKQFAHPAGLVLVDADGKAQRILSPFALDPFRPQACTDGNRGRADIAGQPRAAAVLRMEPAIRPLHVAHPARADDGRRRDDLSYFRDGRPFAVARAAAPPPRPSLPNLSERLPMIPFDAILGDAPNARQVGRIDLRNDRLRVGLTDFGARMLSIEAPNRQGAFDHVLLGFDRADMVLKAGSFGAVLGRYANRIAGGRFTLDGTAYQLSQNDGDNTLHGGKAAFSKRFWTVADRTATTAVFTLESLDGDEGFPGTLHAQATYTLKDNALHLRLTATTDAPTPINLSAHPYFNLGGASALDICDHRLQVHAARFLPTDATQIPTGVLQDVGGTPFDFREPIILGTRIRESDPQLMVARGYDHCFVLDGAPGTMRPAARVIHEASGRVLEMETDMAGLQVYTGNSLNGSLIGHGGTYRMTAGLALEAQAYPDAPNQPSFPSTILRPGETFDSTIVYRFSAS